MNQVKKNPKKVILLGKGSGWEHCPDNDEREVWGLNGQAFTGKKLDKIFVMDVIDEMPSIVAGDWKAEEFIQKINDLDIPLIAPYHYEEIPKSEPFPIEEARREFGVMYFNNTIAYMIAYALLQGVESIDTYGINQASGTEYFYEKACVEYWLGVAVGMGVAVSVNGKHSELLINKTRYGKDIMYGYNMSFDAWVNFKQKFGDVAIKKILQPAVQQNLFRLRRKVGDQDAVPKTLDIIGLKELWKYYSAHPEGRWIMSLNDALNIARIASDKKPQRILDLGTGIGLSAAVLAKAQEGAEVHSVEQYDKCVKIAKELTPKELSKQITYHKADPVVIELPYVPHQKFSSYSEIPEGDWDMVTIDGPGPWDEDGKMIDLPNGTIFQILNNIKPEAMVYLDGRHDAAKLMNRYLQPFLKPVQLTKDFSLYIRTDKEFNESEMVDLLQKSLQEVNYF